MLTNEELKLAKQKYREHRQACHARIDRLGNPIEMRLTFEEWLDIWVASGHYYNRGCQQGQYVMSRKDDVGHYEIDNVEIKTAKENRVENIKSPEFQEKMKSVYSSADWRVNQKYGAQKMKNDTKWQENHKVAMQKAHNKLISCDGIIYESISVAATALAPDTSVKLDSKGHWLRRQIKKYPERYYYIKDTE